MTLAPPGHQVIADVPCRKCGYNLRSLSTDGRCPECGTAVWSSLSVPPDLTKAYGPWLKRIRRGAWCMLIGWLMGATLSAIAFFDGAAARVSDNMLLVLLGVMMLFQIGGGILFSRVEPYTGAMDDGSAVRPIIWVSAALIPFTVFLSLLIRDPSADLMMLQAASVTLLLNQASIILHGSRLAQRTRARLLGSLKVPATILLVCLWVAVWVGPMLISMVVVLPLLMVTSTIPAIFLAWFLIRAPRTGRSDTTPYTQTLTAPAPVN